MLARLTSYVSPFHSRRRTKEEVATDLPDKIVDVVRVDLGEEHRRIYDQYLAPRARPGSSTCWRSRTPIA